MQFVLICVGCFISVACLWTSLHYIRAGYTNGIGFTGHWWRESPTLAALEHYPANLQVYTNATEVLYLYTQRPTQGMPKKFESFNQRPNQNYDEEPLELKDVITGGGGIIIFFDSMMRPTLPSTQELKELLGLGVLEQTADGVIYGIKEQNSAVLWLARFPTVLYRTRT